MVVMIIVVLLSDYIVVGSDSGRIVILEYISTKNIFEKVHQETFGKSGCRRIVPGQYLAIDPKGRAVMIGNISLSSLLHVLCVSKCGNNFQAFILNYLLHCINSNLMSERLS